MIKKLIRYRIIKEVSPDTDTEDSISAEKKTSEDERSIERTLSGRTIRTAKLKKSTDGGTLTLDLVGVTVPAELEWKTSGKVVYRFKDTPYIIKKDK